MDDNDIRDKNILGNVSHSISKDVLCLFVQIWVMTELMEATTGLNYYSLSDLSLSPYTVSLSCVLLFQPSPSAPTGARVMWTSIAQMAPLTIV